MPCILHLSKPERFKDGYIIGAPEVSDAVTFAEAADWVELAQVAPSGLLQRLFTVSSTFSVQLAILVEGESPTDVNPFYLTVDAGIAVVSYTGLTNDKVVSIQVKAI